jgi:UDP-glucose 4-epimerase
MKNVGKIVITGIATHLGRLIARRLHRLGDNTIYAIDQRVAKNLPKDIRHLRVDPRSRRVHDIFRKDVSALVHLAIGKRGRNVMRPTAKLLEYCEDYQVPKVIVLSSAEVYGPKPDNQQFLTEDSPLLGGAVDPLLQQMVTADMQATSYFWRSSHRKTETVVLRPVHILGGLHNRPSNYLRLKRPPVIPGYDPMMQIIHEQDVVEAVVCALAKGVHGVFNVVGPGEVPLSVILDELGKRTVAVPAPLLSLGLGVLEKIHMTRFSRTDISHLRYVGMVDGQRGREVMGFRPRFGLRETMRAVETWASEGVVWAD